MELKFDNRFAALGDAFSAPVNLQALTNPISIHCNENLRQALDIDSSFMQSDTALNAFTGQIKLDGSEPLAMAYAGHQFGHFVPQLGDGRAALLGQIRNRHGQLFDLVVKGFGQSKFSRGADGRAVLRSTIREYLASEAMFHLGIPTTRSLAMFGSDTPVVRETVETAATYIRVAETHIRFGSFEYFYHKNQPENLKSLADYTIENHYQHLVESDTKYDDFMLEVAQKTAQMIAHWQSVGFAHGVMNTDNMSIVGLTFDYGPFGFIDEYDPNYICNSSDTLGRYAFHNQPNIGHWNCMALAQALSPLFSRNLIDDIKTVYSQAYHSHFYLLMRRKLGLVVEQEADQNLILQLLSILAALKLDYTNFFRQLSHISADKNSFELDNAQLNAWIAVYLKRLKDEELSLTDIQTNMRKANPKFILRNYLLQNAINLAEQGDFEEIAKLMTIISKPFDEQPEFENYAQNSPDWGLCMDISCSS